MEDRFEITSCVLLHVLDQQTGLFKLFSAQTTLIEHRQFVDLHVFGQQVGVFELLEAFGTGYSFSIGVRFLVHSQTARIQESLITYFTLEWFIRQMGFHMNHE